MAPQTPKKTKLQNNTLDKVTAAMTERFPTVMAAVCECILFTLLVNTVVGSFLGDMDIMRMAFL